MRNIGGGGRLPTAGTHTQRERETEYEENEGNTPDEKPGEAVHGTCDEIIK